MIDWRAILSRAVSDGTDPAAAMAEVEKSIEDHTAALWLGKESAAITQIIKIMELPLAAGRLDELRAMLAEAETEAREHGCERIICTGRPGWARALDGYRPMTIFVKDL